MMLVGRIAKAEGAFWLAECEAAGAFTQGRSRADASFMLADCIECMVDARGFKVEVVETGADDTGGFAVLVRANKPALLAARVLVHQREMNRLTQMEAAKRMGGKHQSEYAVYERGERVPSIEKYIELLAAVAPDYELVVTPRRIDKKAKAAR